MNPKKTANQNRPKKKRRNPFRYFVYDFVKFTGALPVLVWLRPKIIYESKAAKKLIKGAAVVVSNHVGFTDPIGVSFVLWYRHTHMIAAERLYNTKLSSWFFSHINCIRVDRQNFNMETFRAAVDVLEDGKPLVIFPEGGVNREDHNVTPIKAFKSGAVMMALKGHAPIINVYLTPPEHWYDRFVIVVGESVDPAELCGGAVSLTAVDKVTEGLREKEFKLREIYQQWRMRKSSK